MNSRTSNGRVRLVAPATALMLLLSIMPAAPSAAVVTITANVGPGLNLAVADDAYSGSIASPSMTCVNLPVSLPAGAIVTGVRLSVFSMNHTWVGDLVVKVISPSNTVITLMSMPGVVEAADNGTSLSGDSSNLLGMFPVEFFDGAAQSAENMGNTLANAGVVCRDDVFCQYDPQCGAAAPGKLAAFIGQSPTGTWRVCVGDAGIGDLGTINQCTLVITASVPCPADIDNNSTVSVTDLLAVINAWGACSAPCPPHCAADVNDDCAVSVTDLLAVINAWGSCP